jgi:hypothetical protein
MRCVKWHVLLLAWLTVLRCLLCCLQVAQALGGVVGLLAATALLPTAWTT